MPAGRNDPELSLPLTRLAASCADLLKTRGETVAVCESSAGGLIAAALVAIPGCSAYFVGGAVVYTPAARSLLLGFTEHDMAGLRPASDAYALACARQLRKRFNCTWALAETGATGPTANPYGDPPGHACLAVVGSIERTLTLATGDDQREANMWAFARAALALLQECVASEPVN
ncbi:MAG: CinA family protein [Porticoccaceae bacterium]